MLGATTTSKADVRRVLSQNPTAMAVWCLRILHVLTEDLEKTMKK